MLERHVKLCVTEPDFSEKKFFPKKLGTWTKNGPKTEFFEFIEKFCHHFLLNLFYNYVICYIPEQTPYLGKFLFLKYGPKCSQIMRLQDFLINHISRTNQRNSLIFCMLTQICVN